MCNLYRLTVPLDKASAYFKVVDGTAGANLSTEVYPGYPAAVIVGGQMRRMTWGFPLQLKGKQGQMLKPKPVNNARTDKLSSYFWRQSFEKRRCLIPLTAWSEAEGESGVKTRTWLSLPDQPIFACAGVWRASDEWGDVYSMIMTNAVGGAAECHPRMPVIISPDCFEVWSEGNPDQALSLCTPYAGDVLLDRTEVPWAHRRAADV